MLFISLILSTLLLLAANWLARRSRDAQVTIFGTSFAFLIAPFFLMCISPPLALQSLLLCAAVVVWGSTSRGPSFFLKLSLGATLIAYGLSGILVFQSEREYSRLRAIFPYESMESRLPIPQAVPGGVPLVPASSERLDRLEQKSEFRHFLSSYRTRQLESLHEHTVSLFINSPGFGVARMWYPSASGLAAKRWRDPVPAQPGSRFASAWSPGDLGRLDDADRVPLGGMLEASILDFVNPEGFGYFKDRRHVAGFEPHRFSAVPEPAKRWKVQTLELVSLLLHDEPEVYESSHLPQMDRVHDMRTRPLDRFESFGLEALRQGEDLFATQGDEGVRMLGAVRSFKQCLPCHGGERGALLGAFSYTLRADEPGVIRARSASE